MYGINTFELSFLFKFLSKAFCNAIYTAHSRYNPYFISNANLTVLTHKSFKSSVFLFYRKWLYRRTIFIFQRTGKVRLYIVLIHPFTGFQILFGTTNRISVFDNRFIFGRIT